MPLRRRNQGRHGRGIWIRKSAPHENCTEPFAGRLHRAPRRELLRSFSGSRSSPASAPSSQALLVASRSTGAYGQVGRPGADRCGGGRLVCPRRRRKKKKGGLTKAQREERLAVYERGVPVYAKNVSTHCHRSWSIEAQYTD